LKREQATDSRWSPRQGSRKQTCKAKPNSEAALGRSGLQVTGVRTRRRAIEEPRTVSSSKKPTRTQRRHRPECGKFLSHQQDDDPLEDDQRSRKKHNHVTREHRNSREYRQRNHGHKPATRPQQTTSYKATANIAQSVDRAAQQRS
jgi:hypothetical protein